MYSVTAINALIDAAENRRIKEWDAQTALAELEEKVWFKKL
jgi:uncharacterized membrane protein YjjP (DUF1212 family)